MSVTAGEWAHWPLPYHVKTRLVAEGKVVVRR